MSQFEALVGILLAAVLLAAFARRIGAPYPAFLALGGALLAFVPGVPTFSIQPELALALFVAPVLLDAAYDASPRDLRDNWAPVTGLVVVSRCPHHRSPWPSSRARWMPGMPWAAGDCARRGGRAAGRRGGDRGASTAQAAAPHPDDPRRREPAQRRQRAADLSAGGWRGGRRMRFRCATWRRRSLFAVAGSLVAGPALGWLFLRLTRSVRDVPTAIILQFIGTFGVWILADRIGLSGVLTMVCFAVFVARIGAGAHAGTDSVAVVRRVGNGRLRAQRPRVRLHWPSDPSDPERPRSGRAGTIPLRRRSRAAHGDRRPSRLGDDAERHRQMEDPPEFGFHPPRPTLRPSVRSGLIISWSGMRGIVSLAAALALPTALPARLPIPRPDRAHRVSRSCSARSSSRA